MFVEKKRLGVDPRLFTANGDKNGTVTLADTRGFFVGQIVEISSDTEQPRQLKVKRFVNTTTFKVGPVDRGVSTFSDTSDFLVADNSKISAPEQGRPGITDDDYNRAAYAEEPIVAHRTIDVDEFGNYYGLENPLPVFAVGDDSAETLAFRIVTQDLVQEVRTEIVLPTNLRTYTIKIRDSVCFFEVYESLLGINFSKIERGCVFSTERMMISGNKVFIKTPKNCTVEVLCWIKTP